jgi:hypothetical protein
MQEREQMGRPVHLSELLERDCVRSTSRSTPHQGGTQIFIPVRPLRLVFDTAALRPCVVESSNNLKMRRDPLRGRVRS